MTYIKPQSRKDPQKLFNKSFKNNLCKFSGFSLIEVMIALVIMSIGALGYIEYEIGARRAEYDATMRINAALLVYDMIDRIRANPIEAAKLSSSAYNVGTSLPTTASTNCLGVSNNSCFNNQLAQFDLWDWGQYFKALFPVGSTASVSASGSAFTITIGWPTPGNPTAQQFSAQVQPAT